MVRIGRQKLPKALMTRATLLFLGFVLSFMYSPDLLYGEQAERTDVCNLLGCTKQSACRDIFGHHDPGLAIDVSMVNDKLLCSFGVYFEPSSAIVIGDTNNLVGSLHNNFLEAAKGEGSTVFSPLGAFYFSDGEWHRLPPLFVKTLYQKGEGDQNCVIHLHTENPSKPPLVLLKLGGLWLGDKKKKVFDQYGEASEVREFQDGVTVYIFALDKQKQSYLAVEAFPVDREYIWSIQISSEEKIPLKGLMGIDIGSAERELLSVFGKPTERTAMKDVPGEFLRYSGRNYSFELNEKKRVRSIKIMVPEPFMRYINK